MLAESISEPFDNREWLFEIKWDGYRAVAFIEDGKTRLVSRNQNELTARYPELKDLAKSVKAMNRSRRSVSRLIVIRPRPAAFSASIWPASRIPFVVSARSFSPGFAAIIFTIPYAFNIGTRILIQPLPFWAMVMGIALSHVPQFAMFIVVLHAVLSWPDVVREYCDTYAWRLQKITWREALRRARDCYRRFCRRRDAALLHETLFVTLGAAASRDRTETAAGKALRLFAVDAAQKLGANGDDTEVCRVDEHGDVQPAWSYGLDPYPPRL